MPIPIPIIIVNWKGLSDTLECMSSVLQLEGLDFHIHLVDNGSEDGSAEALTQAFGGHPKVTLHLFDENLGFTGANNRIMEELLKAHDPNDLPWIVLLNNDTTVHPDWLVNLVQCGEETGAGMVSSKMVIYAEPELMDNAGHYMLNTGEILPIGHRKPIGEYTKRCQNLGACAGASLYSAGMLLDIGLFDNHFSTGYEDAELGLRAVVTGYECWYEPSAVVHHKGGQSLNKVRNLNYLISIQSHILYSYFKLMPRFYLWINLPLMVLRYVLIFCFDLAFLRVKYLQMHSRAWWDQLAGQVAERRRKRRLLFRGRKTLTGGQMFRRVEFFWRTDLRRLATYLRDLVARAAPLAIIAFFLGG